MPFRLNAHPLPDTARVETSSGPCPTPWRPRLPLSVSLVVCALVVVSPGGADAAGRSGDDTDTSGSTWMQEAQVQDSVAPQAGEGATGDSGFAIDTLPPPEQITEQRAATDEAIRSSLQALFDRVPSIRGVRVTVEAFGDDNLPHIQAMGVNTIEFMPVMGVPTSAVSGGTSGTSETNSSPPGRPMMS